MPYKHFTPEERKYLQELLSEGMSFREIAATMGRSTSTISREVRRNSAKYRPHRKADNPYRYNHWRAQNLYAQRRRGRPFRAMEPGTEVWDFVLDGLSHFWSPEAICGRWKKLYPERKPLHFSTIYRYIARGAFPKISRKTHLRRRGKRIQTRDANYNSIQPDRTIPEWPDAIRNRTRLGDWEGDTVYGGVGKGLVVTLVDRRSRLVRMGRLGSRNAGETRKVMEGLLSHLPVNSVSLDNGAEFSEFRELEKSLRTEVYFAEPHKPWQRGTNENTNDMIRFFFPKGIDFRAVSDDEIRHVESLLNNRPRKCLGWLTPLEFFLSESVALG